MGAWRALMSRAKCRAAAHHPFLSSSTLSKLEQQNSSLLPAIARFETLPPEASRWIWPGLDLGFLTESHKQTKQDSEALLEDAKEFLLSLRKDLGSLEFRLSEHGLHTLDLRKSHLYQGAFPLPEEQDILSSYAGASVDITDIILQGTTSSCKQHEGESFVSTCDAAIYAPGFRGLEGISIHADSVKRKRKKKMNKHKHRKLRRLARRSRK